MCWKDSINLLTHTSQDDKGYEVKGNKYVVSGCKIVVVTFFLHKWNEVAKSIRCQNVLLLIHKIAIAENLRQYFFVTHNNLLNIAFFNLTYNLNYFRISSLDLKANMLPEKSRLSKKFFKVQTRGRNIIKFILIIATIRHLYKSLTV